MMPECGNIEIKYDPYAKDGFCFGLMQDFGLDISDAKDPDLDDILYIDIDEKGGISSFVSIGLPILTCIQLNTIGHITSENTFMMCPTFYCSILCDLIFTKHS